MPSPFDLNFGNYDPTPKRLWTPDGDRTIEGRKVESAHPAEMRVMASMDMIAQRHGIVLACEKCRRPFRGFNAAQAQTMSIVCGCREIRATMRHSKIISPYGRPF